MAIDKLKPVLIETAGASDGDALVYVSANDKLEFGLSYRLDESVSALFNVRAKDYLRIGYAYDYTLSNLGDFNSGSHEIFLLFNFDFNKDQLKSPRFF